MDRLKTVTPAIAVMMSAMLPGLGQMLSDRVMPGLIWGIVIGMSYLLHPLAGLGLHCFCVIDAFNTLAKPTMKQKIVSIILIIFLIAYLCFRLF